MMWVTFALLALWALLWGVDRVTVDRTHDEGCGGCAVVAVLIVLIALGLFTFAALSTSLGTPWA